MVNSIILDVSDFSFAYGDVQAVRNVSFQVKKGGVFLVSWSERSRKDDRHQHPYNTSSIAERRSIGCRI